MIKCKKYGNVLITSLVSIIVLCIVTCILSMTVSEKAVSKQYSKRMRNKYCAESCLNLCEYEIKNALTNKEINVKYNIDTASVSGSTKYSMDTTDSSSILLSDSEIDIINSVVRQYIWENGMEKFANNTDNIQMSFIDSLGNTVNDVSIIDIVQEDDIGEFTGCTVSGYGESDENLAGVKELKVRFSMQYSGGKLDADIILSGLKIHRGKFVNSGNVSDVIGVSIDTSELNMSIENFSNYTV